MTAPADGLRPEPGPAGADGEEEFRRALGRHAAGVVAVTARHAGRPIGLTATSFTSVSLDPPLVSFYLARSSTSWHGLRGAERFAVNVLAGDQAELARRFSRRGADRFAPPTRWSAGPYGLPLLSGAAAHLICERHTAIELGDHSLVVGRVDSARVRPGRPPLLYHGGRFGRFTPHD
ncbi:flavin reductase family protein [Allonocardiopsis opalescens]|uniref:Flavin reductase (DIM6/NTAB) family NADH-FMN oxidoreductase RutF n=1 Tax=Allonocardiopsis opalescens TaxID=1144618 RepID=A0A2T0Q4R0_9ACTN|nr:flavin reductase family protein [Allonocardiopsis opalescens]PRX98691.1 flavin reductase (DIM6/NTAB) family NADH-FMN oxidoreductase RutF [Allonocardiopsis opalescens]